MPDKKKPDAVPAVAVDPVEEAVTFDDFAAQAAKAAIWPEDVKAHLPKKPT